MVVSQRSFLDLHIYSRQPPGTSLRREDQFSYYRIRSTDFEPWIVIMSSSISSWSRSVLSLPSLSGFSIILAAVNVCAAVAPHAFPAKVEGFAHNLPNQLEPHRLFKILDFIVFYTSTFASFTSCCWYPYGTSYLFIYTVCQCDWSQYIHFGGIRWNFHSTKRRERILKALT